MIQWCFFKALVDYGRQNDFNLTHKMNGRHIDFKNKKMNVRLAVQTLSNSTANSLQFLMEHQIPGFEKAGPTIKFARHFDSLFNIMNTHKIDNNQGNQFKNAINPLNQHEIISYLIEVRKYILGLKVRSQKSKKWIPVVSSRIKTGFRGFIMNIDSVINMYRELVEEQHCIDMIPTYRLSQDHLEMLFCKIRSFSPFDDNPTVQRFKSSYKKVQMISDFKISTEANIAPITQNMAINLLTISSQHKKTTTVNIGHGEHCSEENLEIMERDQNHLINSTIAHVAFQIEARLLKPKGCASCKAIFRGNNDRIQQQYCIGNNVPCRDTFQICTATDRAIEILMKTHQEHFIDKIIHLVLHAIDFNDIFVNFFDDDHDIDHKHYLVRFIINEYVHIKCTFIAKKKNIAMHQKYVRHKYKKITQRAGQ